MSVCDIHIDNRAVYAVLKRGELARAGEFGLNENSVYGEKADIKLPGEATKGLSSAILRTRLPLVILQASDDRGMKMEAINLSSDDNDSMERIQG